ncbi:MAG TPA: hypothetical protein VII73_11540, partial [Caulobacteraceae bacterium]
PKPAKCRHRAANFPATRCHLLPKDAGRAAKRRPACCHLLPGLLPKAANYFQDRTQIVLVNICFRSEPWIREVTA